MHTKYVKVSDPELYLTDVRLVCRVRRFQNWSRLSLIDTTFLLRVTHEWAGISRPPQFSEEKYRARRLRSPCSSYRTRTPQHLWIGFRITFLSHCVPCPQSARVKLVYACRTRYVKAGYRKLWNVLMGATRRRQFRNSSKGSRTCSPPCTNARHSCIGTPEKVWMKWNSQKVRRR